MSLLINDIMVSEIHIINILSAFSQDINLGVLPNYARENISNQRNGHGYANKLIRMAEIDDQHQKQSLSGWH